MTVSATTELINDRREKRSLRTQRSAKRFDSTGVFLDEVELDSELFGIVPNVAVMHQVVTAQLAARRAGTQSTKTRSEVRGGGAKPFRQKGTGRARQGTTRAPHWAGGGVALGPKPRSYEQKTPKKMVRLALKSALSDRARLKRVAVVSSFDFNPISTKEAIRLLEEIKVRGRLLIVVSPNDVEAYKSMRNIPYVSCIVPDQLTTYDVLLCDWVIFTDETLPTREAAENA